MAEICVKWSGKEFTVALQDAETVEDLKRRLQAETKVQPKRQKLIGLKTRSGKPAEDGTPISELALKAGQKYMMMG